MANETYRIIRSSAVTLTRQILGPLPKDLVNFKDKDGKPLTAEKRDAQILAILSKGLSSNPPTFYEAAQKASESETQIAILAIVPEDILAGTARLTAELKAISNAKKSKARQDKVDKEKRAEESK